MIAGVTLKLLMLRVGALGAVTNLGMVNIP